MISLTITLLIRQLTFSMLFVMFIMTSAAGTAAGKPPIELAPVFSDHMVMQRNVPVPVWGTGEPGEKLSVILTHASQDDSATTIVHATAGVDRKWMTSLPAMGAGGPMVMKIVRDSPETTASSITVNDILVGDVWLCSGQSNMAFTLARTRNSTSAVEMSENPHIRLLKVERDASATTRDSFTTSPVWERCEPETVRDFSAVGYFLGRELQQHLNVPIGLIQSAYGGTPVEAWISREGLTEFPEFGELIANNKKARERDRPTSAPAAGRFHRRPTVLFNAMILPLVRFPIKGVAWYQGESNVHRAQQYRRLFPALIVDWRLRWEQANLPFLFVQLPGFHERTMEPVDDKWAELREAQLMTLRAYPRTGMAVTIDLGDAKDIHPIDKEPVGKRLALAARAIAYGEEIVWSGPLFKKATFDEQSVRLSFDHVGSGLATCDGHKLRGFAVAGEDRRFSWADATIDSNDNSIFVTSNNVTRPVAVRYAWAANPDGNLCNREGLRASPFRTDMWPGLTDGLTTDPITMPRNTPPRGRRR